MSDLRDWLRQNKLEQYADAFEANDIDLDILPELSEQDFDQLGLSLGNRRRLIKAIADRGAGPPPAPSKSVRPDEAATGCSPTWSAQPRYRPRSIPNCSVA
jgi:hypothetical protein